MGISLSWETDGRMNMPTTELFDIIFMNEVELKMYEDKGLLLMLEAAHADLVSPSA
jgi:hypothetical protein